MVWFVTVTHVAKLKSTSKLDIKETSNLIEHEAHISLLSKAATQTAEDL